MNTPAKHRHAEETHIRIKTLIESKGWQEFLLPYIQKEMDMLRDYVMCQNGMTNEDKDVSRGKYQALKAILDHIDQHKNFSAGIIAKDELKTFSTSR